MDPELWRCTIFGPKVVHMPPPTQFLLFFENYYYHFHLPIGSFHCAKFKKSSPSGSRVMTQNDNFPQMRIFSENLLMSFHNSCLTTCQKSKANINLLGKYWWLKNTEISLTEIQFLPLSWELDFSQACSSRSMLMNQENFDFANSRQN